MFYPKPPPKPPESIDEFDCPNCGGRGSNLVPDGYWGAKPVECPTCSGKGRFTPDELATQIRREQRDELLSEYLTLRNDVLEVVTQFVHGRASLTDLRKAVAEMERIGEQTREITFERVLQ